MYICIRKQPLQVEGLHPLQVERLHPLQVVGLLAPSSSSSIEQGEALCQSATKGKRINQQSN